MRRVRQVGMVLLLMCLSGTYSVVGQQEEEISKPFSMKGYLEFGTKHGFVEVEIIPDKGFMHNHNIKNRQEYEAVVQHFLHYDARVLGETTHDTMPKRLVFGPVEPERGSIVHDLSVAGKGKRCWCMEPCDGPGSHCYVWLVDRPRGFGL